MRNVPTSFLVAFTIFCSMFAQFFSKKGSQFLHSWGGFFNINVLLCVIFYASSTLSYLLVLKRLPISTAYPLFSITYVLVLLMGHYYFHEALPLLKILGMALIVLGVTLIAYGEYKLTNG